jgi:hypothetical protein
MNNINEYFTVANEFNFTITYMNIPALFFQFKNSVKLRSNDQTSMQSRSMPIKFQFVFLFLDKDESLIHKFHFVSMRT